jgi:hypothetical protein
MSIAKEKKRTVSPPRPNRSLSEPQLQNRDYYHGTASATDPHAVRAELRSRYSEEFSSADAARLIVKLCDQVGGEFVLKSERLIRDCAFRVTGERVSCLARMLSEWETDDEAFNLFLEVCRRTGTPVDQRARQTWRHSGHFAEALSRHGFERIRATVEAMVRTGTEDFTWSELRANLEAELRHA